MDPLSMAFGALFAWACAAYGGHRRSAKLRREAELEAARHPEPPKPVCGCGHHFSLHDGEGCHATAVERILVERGKPKAIGTGYGGQTWKTHYEHEKWKTTESPCGCRAYSGPEPLPTYTDGF